MVVAGMDPSAFAAADNLTHLGASVTVMDEQEAGDREEKATLLEILGAQVRLGPGSTAELPDPADLLVVSAQVRPEDTLPVRAASRGVPVWGEVELAWRLRDPERPAPWLVVSGSRGIGTVVGMLERMLQAGGLAVVGCGTGGLPLVEAVMDPAPYDVMAVGLSAAQLRFSSSMRAHSAAVLDVGPELPPGYSDPAAFAADLARVYAGVAHACVYNLADPATEELVREADVVEGARAIGFTLGVPGVGAVGLVEEMLADRAFILERQTAAAELGTVDDLGRTDPESVAAALAAAALARAFGVVPAAVRDGLRSFGAGSA